MYRFGTAAGQGTHPASALVNAWQTFAATGPIVNGSFTADRCKTP